MDSWTHQVTVVAHNEKTKSAWEKYESWLIKITIEKIKHLPVVKPGYKTVFGVFPFADLSLL